ncbi:MAG: GntR family transcriptional regulator [Luteococcus sp.]|uniref:GntR family transcriptional regulator n=1 Tax=Luteococcus sp. TaxID=1969402 RepID=UPI002647BFE6|nr:GntR family transcriptional regulator [Luteococcus sp.]MDN5562968.1 GntR family transcriptional regulator [Luteococcus sp.]
MPRTLPVVVDRNSPVPLYHQLAEQWASAISSGALKPGDPFENELALVARLHLSRPTIRKAINELVRQGMLVRRRGVGTHVASQVVGKQNSLTTLFDELQGAGRKPRTQVLRMQASRPNRTAAEALGLRPGTPLVYLERLRFSDGQPLVLLRSWLPPVFHDVCADDFADRSLYSVLSERGHEKAEARQRIGARMATARERHLLDLTRADAVLTVEWLSRDADGMALEFGEHSYRGDSYVLDMNLRRD